MYVCILFIYSGPIGPRYRRLTWLITMSGCGPQHWPKHGYGTAATRCNQYGYGTSHQITMVDVSKEKSNSIRPQHFHQCPVKMQSALEIHPKWWTHRTTSVASWYPGIPWDLYQSSHSHVLFACGFGIPCFFELISMFVS